MIWYHTQGKSGLGYSISEYQIKLGLTKFIDLSLSDIYYEEVDFKSNSTS